MLMDPHPSQEHAGLQHVFSQLQQEEARSKARFKPTLPEKSGVDGGANQVPTEKRIFPTIACVVWLFLKRTIKKRRNDVSVD